MAEAVGLGVATVQKTWKAHGLAPHRGRSFKLSKDPAFAEKRHDIVWLYVNPPARAVTLSVDESERANATGSSRPRTQIQALDRTQPGLPIKNGRAAPMTHVHKRDGTTTLFAALNVLTGEVFGQNMQRHRHPGVHPVPERPRARDLGGQSRSCDPGQRRRTQDA